MATLRPLNLRGDVGSGVVKRRVPKCKYSLVNRIRKRKTRTQGTRDSSRALFFVALSAVVVVNGAVVIF